MLSLRLGAFEFNIGKKQNIVGDALADVFADTQSMTSGVPATKSTARTLQENRGWVYDATSVISDRVSTLGMTLVTTGRDGKKVVVEEHPFLDMWQQPNPFFTGTQFMALSQTYLDLAGESFWLVIRNGMGMPQQLWPIPPNEIEIKVNQDGTWSYIHRPKNSANFTEYTQDQIVYMRYPHTTEMLRGWSPLKATALAYDEDKLIQEYHWNFLKHGGLFMYALMTEKSLTEGQARQVQKSWMRRFFNVRSHADVPVLPYGLKPVSLQKDVLSFGASGRETVLRDRILAAYKVPRAVLGITEGLPRANVEGASVQFNMYSISPRLRLWKETLDILLTSYRRPVTVMFENPVPVDRASIGSELKESLVNGAISINEYRRDMNIKLGYTYEVRTEPAADQLLIPFNRLPLSSSSASDGSTRNLLSTGIRELDSPGPHIKTVFSEEQKTALWKSFDSRLTKNERVFNKFMVDMFTQMEKETEEKLEAALKQSVSLYAKWSELKVRAHREKVTKQDAALIVPNIKRWETHLIENGGALIAEIFNENGEAAMNLIGLETDFDLENFRSRFWLGKRTEFFSSQVLSSHFTELNETLTEGFANGESIDQLTARVQGVYTNAKTWQAERTARTETLAASNQGTLEGYKQSGVQKKSWLSARDGSVRDTHVIAEQEYGEGGSIGPIPVDADFIVGTCSGPGPGNLGCPEEDIQCRCTILPEISEPAE